MSCYTGDHLDFKEMTCINYAGLFTKIGEPDPIDLFVEEFLKEEVEFNMPKNVRSWK
jgi:hypothetical protein